MVTCFSVISYGQRFGTQCLILIAFWICCYGVNPESATPWKGSIFGLILLFLTSYCAGLVSKLLYLPPVIGMLCAPIALANVNVPISVNQAFSSFARDLALAIILLRAGLSLNPSKLRKLSWVCLRLAITPCLIEACTLAVFTYYLIAIPFFWCMVIGFVCVATSPAIIVPAMIKLQKEGYGTDKGIPTLAIGGSSFDDVLAITGFEIFLSLAMVTSKTFSVVSTLKGPVEAFIGLVLGTSLGLLFWFIPPSSSQPGINPNHKSHLYGAKLRFCLLFFFGIGFIFMTKTLGFDSTGPLATLSLAFFAGLRWRKEGYLELISISLKDIWFFCEIFLFALIGYEVKFASINTSTLLWSSICILVGLVTRMLAAFLSVTGAGYTLKEKVFIAMAWLPKGTVQAAAGSIPLELARLRGDEESIDYGLITLNYAVLSILFSAPLGSFLINFFSTRFLTKSTKQQYRTDRITSSSSQIEDISFHV